MPMNPAMRMMMIDRIRQPQNNGSEYGGGNRRMIGYDRGMDGNATTSNYGTGYGGMDTENRRRRDSRGRYMESGGGAYSGGYDDDMPSMGGYGGPEARRRRDSRGRYMMDGMDYEDDPHSYSPHMMGGSSYGDIYAKGTIYAPGAQNRPGMIGMEQEWSKPVDEHTARKWVGKMDGGEKYKPEQIEQLRQSICPECNKWEFYVAMNAMYSDYCKTAKEMGIDKPDLYARLARDFLMDEDAKPHKLRMYMETIAK